MNTTEWTPPRNWRWMVGMAAIDMANGRWTVIRVRERALHAVGLPEGCMTVVELPASDFVPDLEDPATRGCLLALVREVWGDERLSTVYCVGIDMRGPWAVWCSGFIPQKARLLNKRFGTEAEALLFALEAAP